MIRVDKNWLGDLATLRLPLAPQSLLNFNSPVVLAMAAMTLLPIDSCTSLAIGR
jgi:hypothetical protein